MLILLVQEMIVLVIFSWDSRINRCLGVIIDKILCLTKLKFEDEFILSGGEL